MKNERFCLEKEKATTIIMIKREKEKIYMGEAGGGCGWGRAAAVFLQIESPCFQA